MTNSLMTKLKKIVILLISILLGVYLLICLSLYFSQERLLFFPQPVSQTLKKSLKAKEVNFNSGSISLVGWQNHKERENLIIYYGGNGEQLSYLVEDFAQYDGFSSLLVSYRGYEDSEGEPTQDALFEDALHIYDEVAADYKKIFIVGRSLGSGVACYISSKRNVEAIALITPYDSISNTAQQIYPFLPMKLIVAHPFDSVSLADKIQTPAIFVVAEQDEIIGKERSQELFNAWAGEKTWLLKEGQGHNTYSVHPKQGGEIFQFFKKYIAP